MVPLTLDRYSSSQMLDLYYHLHDDDSQQTMMALAKSASGRSSDSEGVPALEGNLRAMGQSKIEKPLQVPEVQGLVTSLANVTERAGFEPAVGINPTRPFQDRSLGHSDTSPTAHGNRVAH
jgi:hypothetical protein